MFTVSCEHALFSKWLVFQAGKVPACVVAATESVGGFYLSQPNCATCRAAFKLLPLAQKAAHSFKASSPTWEQHHHRQRHHLYFLQLLLFT